jgi:uncharacterized protein YbcC (UPF0753/DUF2309 family)
MERNVLFDEQHLLHELKHYLPAQSPLKDFVHHNTLHAFQDLRFFDAINAASEIFGYKTSLSIDEFRYRYSKGEINHEILIDVIGRLKGKSKIDFWKAKMLDEHFETVIDKRIGHIRENWKKHYRIDLDAQVHTNLFRLLNSYLDQGVAMWHFPVHSRGFLTAVRELERQSYISLFKTERARKMFLSGHVSMEELLKIVVGDERYFEAYIFDQQFAHPGWSGLVAVIEDNPKSLLVNKRITLKELVVLELLFEIDALDHQFSDIWAPLSSHLSHPVDLFKSSEKSTQSEVLRLWQEAMEWSFFDQVLLGMKSSVDDTNPGSKSFQALFCIDDRICSLRRYIENLDPKCLTYGTPGHFGIEFYYQPDGGKFHTKVCPAPITPKFLIKEVGKKTKNKKDVHFSKSTHHYAFGWLISQTVGFWSALRLFLQIFRPSLSPATAYSFNHMDKFSELTIEHKQGSALVDGLTVGFTVTEMTDRIEAVLRSIGLVDNFAPIVYAIGHGASSVNNTHYAGYDCGACSGRPGSVNARVFCFMANHKEVRTKLRERGIVIPEATQFLGGLHDTTRDEFSFYDENSLNEKNNASHSFNKAMLSNALDLNAKERSRRFMSIDSKGNAAKIHEKVKLRSVSLFEPRPELNHATNSLCIVGRRGLTKDLFLDRRSFMNSYNYEIDPDGKYLLNILNAAAPVCGGINLEYYFSRVDNQKLGAGSKLPHNVMGLIGVANGIEGDLRPGLPYQMIEVHDPLRLMIIVEHKPDVVLDTILRNPATYNWFINEWVRLAVIDPVDKSIHVFADGAFSPYSPVINVLRNETDLMSLLESSHENLPVLTLNN